MYILVLIFPLLGFIMAAVFGRYFGRDGSAYIATFGLFLTLLLSILLLYEVTLTQSVVSIKLYR
jgi:NADH:ubiquinone oxidoreductase subunit 5 (subunit L)/multisubunit Na+/H+ antiporter MnhA subunit